MKIVLNLILLFSFFLFNFSILCQVDFNNYKTLKSVGPIPKDFVQSTSSKIEENLKVSKKSKSESKLIYQYLNLGIDKILNSGQVVYGDEVSNYVKEVARILLKDDEKIFNQLRFYTLKSNECNAFSTDQGIIFVTTGLIAQLENEAQLACVLAHEIAHYTEKHVLESFDFIKNNKKLELKEFSTYSKEKEFEADKIGIKWYNDAGYSEEELLSTFDVLLYSYLPFDEVEVPKNYFNTENLTFPESHINFELEEIKAIEDFDDSESSHPNIKKRKKAVESEIDNFNNWANNSFIMPKETFNMVRNICRFEYLRSAMIKHDFEKVLYSAFLLEKEFPNSIYLEKMKAQTWYNLLKKRRESDERKPSKEGEIGFVYHFIKSLKKEELSTLALKNIYEAKKKYPQNQTLSKLYTELIKALSKDEKFRINDYSLMTFKEAIVDFDVKKAKLNEKDTTVVVKSKYEKIKKNKSDNVYTKDFDSTTFYLYGIPELISDSIFINEFKYLSKIDTINFLINKNKSIFENYNIQKVVYLEPKVDSYFREKYNLSKSIKLSSIFSEALNEITNDFKIENSILNFNQISSEGTDAFNDRNLLFNFLNQSVYQEFIYFTSDFEEMQEIVQRLKTSKIIFTNGNHKMGRFLFFKRHTMNFNYYLIDFEESNVLLSKSFVFHGAPVKYNLGARFYDFIFSNPSNEKK